MKDLKNSLILCGDFTMNKIEWCLRQKKGITLIERNENLAKDYVQKSEEALESMAQLQNINWKSITGYYACYNMLFSLLMKCGIKCEIHECSLELMKLFSSFDEEDVVFIKKLKDKRIDVQYYLKDAESLDEEAIKSFVLKCKKIIIEIKDDEINDIRKKLKND